ncbi:MAG: hypothetical protein DRG78_07200 [Epsilonproteobacteria bacterium]|nr:MAG: hypothetical protein DRG78_07200 [Campylobacterota bacterium]
MGALLQHTFKEMDSQPIVNKSVIYARRHGLRNIDNDFIISEDNNGNILSVFGDNIWDLAPLTRYSSRNITLNFHKDIVNKVNIKQQKHILFIIMITGKNKQNAGYSANSLLNYNILLKNISKFAEKNNTVLFNILSNHKLCKRFIEDPLCNLSHNKPFRALLVRLHELSNTMTGINFKENRDFLDILSKRQEKSKENEEQTAVIPTLILAKSLNIRWQRINEISEHLDGIVAMIYNLIENENSALDSALFNNKKKEFDNCTSWLMDVNKYNLDELFSKYNIDGKRNFSRFIIEIQSICNHLIHAYSGMRKDEVLSIERNCFSIVNNVAIIKGITTKYVNQPIEAEWITSKAIKPVINILEVLEDAITTNCNKVDHFLFISSGLIKYRTNKINAYKQTQNLFHMEVPTSGISNISLTITEDDIEELEEIDDLRDWRTDEKFKVGAQWHFTSHQYRRSLAVYAVQSGLVSIGSIQYQFKHLCKEISFYYQNGAANAKNILRSDEYHIGLDMAKEKPRLDALSYYKNVLLCDDNIGVNGKIINEYTKDKDKSQILANRDETMKEFALGNRAYRDTVLGGCSKIGFCDVFLSQSLIECISCENSIHNKTKLLNAIKAQEEFINSLEEDNPVKETEVEILRILKKYLKNEG